MTYKYEGKPQPEKVDGEDSDKHRIYCPYPYLPSDDLKEAVNLAIALKRPLLLEGEPGCGKTRLAGAVAYEFTQKYLKGQKNQKGEQKWWDYYIWNVKSTTRARDGLYRFDAIARLRDAQLIGNNLQQLREPLEILEIRKLKKRLQDKKEYREFGALGKALQKHEHRPILLIDEIDKADSYFANDLLLELEELRFEIPETGEEFPTPPDDLKPIIFITSNREKPLPEAFLRRCLYFFVDFPAQNKDESKGITLEEIIKLRFGEFKEDKEKLLNEAISRFYDIREHLEKYPGSKAPGTSEFIDFIKALLEQDNESEVDLNNLLQRMSLLGTLLKTNQDQKLISKFLKEKSE